MPNRNPSRTPARRSRQRGDALGIPANYGALRRLKRQREATRLVSIGRADDDGRILRATPRAAAAWQRMRTAAARDGVVLLPLSAFRSVARQTRIIRAKLDAGQRIADILRLVAAPGYSEHHTGRAIDIGSPEHIELDEDFARTAAFRWLRRHAGEFGFHLSYPRGNPHGIAYEPWHWCLE
ncbi:MAG: D-alanyl-D-alanine carboxypeptidase family protein [Opitutus sp.]|nr:D-alanyl-D-alanine carboxypeptidase family protein [Opitutus sp.]